MIDEWCESWQIDERRESWQIDEQCKTVKHQWIAMMIGVCEAKRWRMCWCDPFECHSVFERGRRWSNAEMVENALPLIWKAFFPCFSIVCRFGLSSIMDMMNLLLFGPKIPNWICPLPKKKKNTPTHPLISIFPW